MRTTTQLGLAAVLMLVCLRVTIGWHFFKEGTKKYNDPSFSSAGFLGQAKGPLAKMSHGMAGEGFHDWDRWMAVPQRESPLASSGNVEKSVEADPDAIAADAPYKAWAEQVIRDWKTMLQSTIDAAKMDEKQRANAASAYERRVTQLRFYLAEQHDDLVTYQHELFRLGEMESGPIASDVPFQRDRIAQKWAEVASKPASWKASVRSIEESLETDLLGGLSEQQRAAASAFQNADSTHCIDLFVTYLLIAIGACLIVGLFTRTAAFAAALFLLSVVVLQPPWAVGAAPTYYQWVELFGALVLGTTHVGKWGGLDFFISTMLGGCCGGKCSDRSA